MKSLLKSYNTGNAAFYENLHRKYFDKAKNSSEKKPADHKTIEELEASKHHVEEFSSVTDENLFDLSKSNNLGLGFSTNQNHSSKATAAPEFKSSLISKMDRDMVPSIGRKRSQGAKTDYSDMS